MDILFKARSEFAVASADAIAPIVSLERCMGLLHLDEIEADRADFVRVARTLWTAASFASSDIKVLSSGVAFSCSTKAGRLARNTPGNSAQELDSLLSTVQAAPIRGSGGSMPNGPGISQDGTQVQNLCPSASRKCR